MPWRSRWPSTSRSRRRRRTRARVASGGARVSRRRWLGAALGAVAIPGRARPRLLRRGAGRGAARRARPARTTPRVRPGPSVLRDASELEGHADNVAASLYGGVVAVAAGRVVRIPLARELAVVVWVPETGDRHEQRRAASSPTRSPSTTRCSTSVAPRCSSPRSRPATWTPCASRPRTGSTRTAASPACAEHARRDRRGPRRGCVRGMVVGIGTVGRRVRRSRRRRTGRAPRSRPGDVRSCSTSTTKGRRSREAEVRDRTLAEARCVVVTGAAGGIGAALARRFAAEGARGIVVADRSCRIEAAGTSR